MCVLCVCVCVCVCVGGGGGGSMVSVCVEGVWCVSNTIYIFGTHFVDLVKRGVFTVAKETRRCRN